MTDNLTTEQRRKNMQAIRSISQIETIFSKELWKKGVRFRRNVKDLYGKPDIAIKKYKIVIFIDSCFWHQCPLHAVRPKSNTDYWEKKLARNVARDKEVNDYYEEREWKILRIWEHEIKGNLSATVDATYKFINDTKQKSI